jgi:hypothetical protein
VLFFFSFGRLNFGVKEAAKDLGDAADADKFSPTVDVTEEEARQTIIIHNLINVGQSVQKVPTTKVLVEKSTQTDYFGGSYNLQFVLNHLYKMSRIVTSTLGILPAN